MLKKTAAAVTAIFMSISAFTGCSSDNQDKSSEQTDAAAETTAAEAAENAVQLNKDWTFGQVAVGGGGFVTGVFSTCEENVYYARTDVGGAYRWDESQQKWKSLNYWVSEADVGFMGISSIAVDPKNAANVYLLAGTEYFSGGKTAVLKSTDYGETFKVIEVTDKIKVHGNGMGRGNGERIAVDPNNSDIIFAAGCSGGMIKSTDAGETWEAVESFPVKSTTNSNGINIIVFDPSAEKDGATQRIYAAVSQKKAEEGNIFVSEDGGATWNPLENAHNDDMPERIKLDSKGNLYIVYSNNEGPWNAMLGGVHKYDIETKTSTVISPDNSPYGDILIDPTDENKMVLVTTQTWKEQPNGSYGDVFYVTSDGGKTWTNILDKMTMSTNGMPWIEDCAIHWCCSLAMNPVNTSEIMVTSGNGIFACDNIWDESPEFYFNSLGIEETVPMDMITMIDYPLVSAALDYDGFVHEDITVPAERHGDKIGSTTSITVAAQNRDYWAKVGGNDSEQLLTYSTDGGKTWTKITNSPESGKVFYNGSVALTADGSRLIWSSEKGYKTYYTEDWGATWTECEGIMGNNLYIMGDAVNSDYVYACGNENFYISSDGGKTFKKNMTVAPRFRRVCVSPTEEGVFYIPCGAGLFKSTDHGETIDFVKGMVNCEAVSLGKAKNEGDPYVLYVYGNPTTEDPKGIYMSEDDGASWVRINDDAHQFGGTGNGGFICGDLNVYGRCYMSTVGLGIVYCDKIEK